MDDTSFSGDPFFNDGSIEGINDESLQQMNDGTLQNQIDHLDPSAVGGIGALDAVPLPVNPIAVERLLSLHHNGCSNRLSWSRQGHIASISEDGTSIDLQYLVFDRRKRSWLLGPVRNEHVGLGQLASLAWSPMATDLAVVDVDGRLSVLRPVGTAANRLTEVRAGSTDHVQELGQAIGVHWLSQDRAERAKQVVQHTSKSQESDKWVHNLVKALPLQPLYQRAILVVTQSANLSLIYEKPDGSFDRITSPLIPNSEVVYTHAAFAPTTGGRLLVAIHAYNGTLSAYSVGIDFTPVKADGPPALTVQLAASRLPCIHTTGLDGQIYDPDSQYLTHLGIIPTTEVEKAARLPPTVYGVYANLNKNVAANDGAFLSTSTIRRWTLSPTEQVLHPKFNEISTKAKPVTSTPTTSVERLPDKDEQAITNAILLENGQGIYITTLDGHADFLSDDLASLTFPSADNTVSSLAQSGFTFPLIASPSILALSPNLCCAAVLSPSHNLQLSINDYHPPDQNRPLDAASPAADAANAVVVLSFARSCWTNSNIDDLLCMVMQTFPSSMAHPLIVSLYQTLFRETEFMHEKDSRSELEKVVQKPVLTKVFSFHYGVAFLSTKNGTSADPLTSKPSTNTPVPLSSQWVWVASNLRFVAQLLYISIREVQVPNADPSSELIEMVCGNIKWTLDLIRYIAASVLEVSDRETNPDFFNPPKHPHQTSVDGSQGLVALLLNCHWSRQFFIAIVRAMRVLCKLPEPRSPPQMEIIKTIMLWSQGKGLNLVAVEALLDPRWSGWADNELGNDMQKISARQIRMMATGFVEGGYQGTVKRIATKLYNVGGGMREKKAVDRLKLWQSKVDLGWVLLDDGWEGEEEGDDIDGGGRARSRRVFDVHKKKVITKGVRESGSIEGAEEMIKRCVRCGRHNEDVNGMGKEFPRHVAGLMMRCVCDGPWIVETWSRAVAA